MTMTPAAYFDRQDSMAFDEFRRQRARRLWRDGQMRPIARPIAIAAGALSGWVAQRVHINASVVSRFLAMTCLLPTGLSPFDTHARKKFRKISKFPPDGLTATARQGLCCPRGERIAEEGDAYAFLFDQRKLEWET